MNAKLRLRSGLQCLELPVNLLQSCTDHFNGEEFEKFVANIEGRIKYEVPGTSRLLVGQPGWTRPDSPDNGGEEELVVVLQRSQHGLAQQQVGEDAASEDDEHGGDPEGEGMFP